MTSMTVLFRATSVPSVGVKYVITAEMLLVMIYSASRRMFFLLPLPTASLAWSHRV
jgi:hypothetical protein